MAFYHITPACNLRRILASGLVARRGARAKDAGEHADAVWLFVGKDGLEYGIMNWLDSMFEDNAKIACFGVLVDEKDLEVDGIEAASARDIPPEKLLLITRDIDEATWFDLLAEEDLGSPHATRV